MSLLSKQLFDHCSVDEEVTRTPETTMEIHQYNPGSGLPLINNGGVDVGGYVYGDGPSSDIDDNIINTHDLYEDTFASTVFEDTCSLSESTDCLVDDNHLSSPDYELFYDDF